MKDTANHRTPFGVYKFRTLNLDENRLILIKKNKEETSILFSELNKIYIKKYKFSFLNKIGLSSLLLVPTFLFLIYLPMEMVLLKSILDIILIARIITFKRYQLNVIVNDGTFFIKNFKKDSKQDNIKIVNVVRKKIFENQIRSNIQKETPSTEKTRSEVYAYPSLIMA